MTYNQIVTISLPLAEAYIQAIRVMERRIAGAQDGDQVAAEVAAVESVRKASVAPR
jgi:hypothetical protein